MRILHFNMYGKRKISRLLAPLSLFILIVLLNLLFLKNSGQLFPLQETITPGLSSSIFSYLGSSSENNSKRYGELSVIIEVPAQSSLDSSKLMSSGCHVVFSIVPYGRFSSLNASKLYNAGYEIMACIPESFQLLQTSVSDAPVPSSIEASLLAAAGNIPHASGICMISDNRKSAPAELYKDIITVLERNNLLLIYSREILSEKNGSVPPACDGAYTADIIIKESASEEYVKTHLNEAAMLSLKNGRAITVIEPGRIQAVEAANIVKEMKPFFDSNGIKLKFISELQKY